MTMIHSPSLLQFPDEIRPLPTKMRVPKATIKEAWAIVRPELKSLGLYEATQVVAIWELNATPETTRAQIEARVQSRNLKRPKWTTDIHIIEPLEAWILLYPCIVTTQRGKVVEAYEYNDVV